MGARWTSRSIRAVATMASPRISPHCSKPRFTHAGAGGVAGEDLRFKERLEEALVGPLLLARPARRCAQPLEHAWRVQLREQVGEPLTGLRRLTCTTLRSQRAR